MTPNSAMVLTGKQSLDFSGGVSAEDNFGIGGYDRVMGPNGQAQYWAPNLTAAREVLMAHYDHTYVVPGESAPRKAGTRRVSESAPRRRSPGELPSMTTSEVAEVCANLRGMLGGEVGHHPRLPSLALLERALGKNGERGIDDVPAAVLRHAAQALDAFDLDRYGPGLVLLRRRIEQVLRRRHGDRHTHVASQPDQPTERLAAAMAPGALKDFSDSMTEFIDIDRMFGDRKA